MRVRCIVAIVALLALLGLLAGCASNADPLTQIRDKASIVQLSPTALQIIVGGGTTAWEIQDIVCFQLVGEINDLVTVKSVSLDHDDNKSYAYVLLEQPCSVSLVHSTVIVVVIR